MALLHKIGQSDSESVYDAYAQKPSEGTIAKYKTASQMFAVLLTIVLVPGPYAIIARIVLYVSVFLTALSGADYIWKNRKFLRG